MRIAAKMSKFGKLILLACALYLFSGMAIAQAAGSESSPAGQIQTSSSSDLAKQSQEAGNQDEQAEFKHSASVRLIARWTGLSLDGAYWLCVVLNFAVILAAIVWASKKNLPGMFRDRTASIQHAMSEARKTSEEATRRLSDIESRLSKLGSEIQEMRVAAEKEAVDEEVRIRAAAVEEARKIVESAQQEIATAGRTARRELRAYVADLAVSLARKQIHVDTPTDQELIRSLGKQLDAQGPAKG